MGHLRYHHDVHGNVTALLDWNGNGLEKYTYDAFGRPTVTNWDGSNTRRSSNYGNRFMFQGREWFSEFSIYDYRNRFYAPALGRFLQVDPKGFDAGDMNLFRYCADDPVDHSDPMGLETLVSGAPAEIKQRTDLVNQRIDHMPENRVLDALRHQSGIMAYHVERLARDARPSEAGIIFAQISEGTTNPRALGMAGVRQAEADLATTGQYFGYSYYDVNGKIIPVKSLPGQWVGGHWEERYVLPNAVFNSLRNGTGEFLANGHLHPKPDHEHPHGGESWSGYDTRLSAHGPVLRRIWGTARYDEINRGVRSVVGADGSTERTY